MAASCMGSHATDHDKVNGKDVQPIVTVNLQTYSLLVLMHEIQHAKPLLMEVCM